MGGGMRAVKIATIAMGLLIVLGTTVILVTIVKRTMTGPAAVPEKAFAAVLDEPPGTSIVGVAQARDKLAVQLRGGGPDRVLDEAESRALATKLSRSPTGRREIESLLHQASEPERLQELASPETHVSRPPPAACGTKARWPPPRAARADRRRRR